MLAAKNRKIKPVVSRLAAVMIQQRWHNGF
jgi:hypothetical protein